MLINVEGSMLDAVDDRHVDIRGEKIVAEVEGRNER
jgi:hypothetical protein